MGGGTAVPGEKPTQTEHAKPQVYSKTDSQILEIGSLGFLNTKPLI